MHYLCIQLYDSLFVACMLNLSLNLNDMASLIFQKKKNVIVDLVSSQQSPRENNVKKDKSTTRTDPQDSGSIFEIGFVFCIFGTSSFWLFCTSRVPFTGLFEIQACAEGRGVFAACVIPADTEIGFYGGELSTKDDIVDWRRDYLIEFTMLFGSNDRQTFFRYPKSEQLTMGMMYNHSRKHPNLRKKAKLNVDGEPDVAFFTKRAIKKGEQLVHDYSRFFQRVLACVESCCGEY